MADGLWFNVKDGLINHNKALFLCQPWFINPGLTLWFCVFLLCFCLVRHLFLHCVIPQIPGVETAGSTAGGRR